LMWSILTDIYLCHACFVKKLRVETLPGQVARVLAAKFEVRLADHGPQKEDRLLNQGGRVAAPLLLQRILELTGVRLKVDPHSSAEHGIGHVSAAERLLVAAETCLDPCAEADVEMLLPRVCGGAGALGFELAPTFTALQPPPSSSVEREGKPSAAEEEEEEEEEEDSFKTLTVGAVGGGSSWRLAQAMLRHARRLDRLGSRAEWHRPGGAARGWATERYRGESTRLVIEPPWLQFSSECRRL
jgi:hypothetical protein